LYVNAPGGIVTLANTLIANNTASTSGPDVDGLVTSSDHDLIGNDSGSSADFSASNGDIVNTAVPLNFGKNGGPIVGAVGPFQQAFSTMSTYALPSGSPAIDAGDNNAAPGPTDERGFTRIVGSAIDIGAYEFGATAAQTDLSVTGNAPANASAGGQVTYTLTVTNNGPSSQNGIVLSDALPADTTLVSWTAPSGWNSSAPPAGSSQGSVTASNGSLNANSSAVFTLVVQINSSTPAGTVLTDTPMVGPLTGDPVPANNSITLETTVLQSLQFVVTAPSPEIAGVPFPITVTAETNTGQVVPTYNGTVHFTSTDPHPVLPADTTLINGTGTFFVTLNTTSTESITATDTNDFSVTGTTNPISVELGKFVVAVVPDIIAGDTFPASVFAETVTGQIDPYYQGTAQLTCNDPNAVLPASVAVINGVGQFSPTLNTTGMRNITATDKNSSLTGTSDAVTVEAGRFHITTPANATLGMSFQVVIEARTASSPFDDLYYDGTVNLTTSDPYAAMPATVTLHDGSISFIMTLNTPGPQTITATDTKHPSLTVISSSINVTGRVDVGLDVSVARGGFHYDLAKQEFVQTITIKNTSNRTLFGPLALELGNLSSGATLANASGTDAFDNEPYIDFLSLGQSLAPGKSISITLYFIDPTKQSISYFTRVLQGLS
jgi:uncharacterized repeat protein (TIGR01451 family)